MTTLGPYDLNTIITGDARELAKVIPDESVDLIFTDPVYDRIEDYKWLAETAARVLKPEKSVLAFAWTPELRKILFATEVLHYHGIASLYISNRTKDTRNQWGFNKWTPLIWLSRGDAKSPRTADLIQCKAFHSNIYSNGSSNHMWSKPPEFIAHYIQKFTKTGDIIFEPFTGGGTVPAVCKMLQRNYLAFEIDPDTADMARQRVAETQPPLPIVYHEQMELI